MDRYYKILGLAPGADKQAIKKAYRKLAMKYHPDRNPGPGARAKFMEVLEAYEYLTGMNRAGSQQKYKAEDLEKLRDILEKAAKEKARKQYQERARQFREEKEKEQARQYTMAIYSLVGIVVLAFSVYMSWNWYFNMMIDENPAYTVAKVSGIGQNNMLYTFRIENELHQDEKYVHRTGIQMRAGNGMPLRIGDQFEMVYREDDISYHRINFNKLSGSTMDRYLGEVSREIQDIYREEWQDWTAGRRKRVADCITLFIYKEYRFDGLSTVIFRKTIFLENFSHNSLRWYFMKKSDKYKHILRECSRLSGHPPSE